MQVISRAEAKAQGLKRYYTGKPCKHGHDAERYVSGSMACVACSAEGGKRWYQNNKQKAKDLSRKWGEDNKERRSETNKRWYEANKERHTEKGKLWYEANKESHLETSRRWRERNKERKAEGNKRWYEKNKEYCREYSRRWTEENKERRQETSRRWGQENKERRREITKRWVENNKERNAETVRRRRSERYATEPNYRAREAMRNMLYRSLGSKSGRTHDLLGYSPQELREHLERQFTKGMSWYNHGEWHVDHIIPIAQMIRDGETDPAKINCLSNLRPIWAADNIRKSDSIETLL